MAQKHAIQQACFTKSLDWEQAYRNSSRAVRHKHLLWRQTFTSLFFCGTNKMSVHRTRKTVFIFLYEVRISTGTRKLTAANCSLPMANLGKVRPFFGKPNNSGCHGVCTIRARVRVCFIFKAWLNSYFQIQLIQCSVPSTTGLTYLSLLK